MKRYSAPKLEHRFVCITSDRGDTSLPAIASSYFNDPTTYVPIFKFPDVNRGYTDSAKFDEDDFFSFMSGSHTRIKINNTIARLAIQRVLLIGLSNTQKSWLNFLPEEKKLQIDNIEEIYQKLQFLEKRFNGNLQCRRDEITKGLLIAKRTNKKLLLDNTADTLSWDEEKHRNGLAVLECRNDISDIIAVNYAYAINADISFVKPIDREEVDELQRYIYEWKKNSSQEAYSYISGKILERVSSIDFTQYKYVTFITQGLPYGAMLNNLVPMSHVFRSLREDFFFFNNIICERSDSQPNSALIFSPEEFENEEIHDLIQLLESNKFYMKKLIGPRAGCFPKNSYRRSLQILQLWYFVCSKVCLYNPYNQLR